jgi:hypothetical protein
MTKFKTEWLWYLVPIVFSIIGGVIGYFILKDDDKELANQLLIIGVIVFLLQIIGFRRFI